jgi:glycosyltransferase involved in cell wall biosynthesis
MSLQLSVIIPTYNGRQRIGLPLAALAKQDAAEGCFEVIVVDNGSTDGTADAVAQDAASARLSARGWRVRIVRENRPGLSVARLRGVREASGEIVCFLDDDTEPAADYVATGLRAMPQEDIGLLISRIFPRYQADPPPSVRRREHLLAINDRQGNEPKEFASDATLAPTIGAGMWVRRDACLRALTEHGTLMSDRVGQQLYSGGDIELGLRIGRMGLKRLYVPGLVLHHHIPPSRFRCGYICRLIIGIVRSELTLRQRYPRLDPPPPLWRAVASLLFAIAAVPVLVLRTDGLRETAFVLASRWARVLGPYRTTLSDDPVRSAAEVLT